MSDVESVSGSDSEPEFESIIATRARRSNAGSRLRQLLDLEESNAGVSVANEDDENVNLLFEEDEDDFEFMAEDEESGDEDKENGNDDDDEDDDDNMNDDNSKRQRNKTSKNGSKSSNKTKKLEDDANSEGDEDGSVNPDEMLSDSDISASDDDDEEGERELQQQEKLKRRRKRKADLPVAALRNKKAKKNENTIKKTSQKQTKAESASRRSHKSSLFDTAPISLAERRHSARSATLKNSIETHEKLEEEYKRRKTIAPVAKKEYVEKTLEERLEEAKITEVENTLSLTRFYEQEIQKKKKQRDAANSRKFSLKNYMRFWSTGVYVTPMDEIDEIEEEKRILQEEEEKRIRRKLQYLKRKQARLGNSADLSEEIKQLTKGIEIKDESEVIPLLEKEDEQVEDSVPEDGTSDIKQIDAEVTTSKVEPELENKKEQENGISTDLEKNGNHLVEPSSQVPQQNEEPSSSPRKNVRFNEEVDVLNGDENEQTRPLSVNAEEITENDSVFANEDDMGITNNAEGEESKTPEIIYEGPARKVTRDYIIFEEFDSVLTAETTKKLLLGPQSLRTGTMRDPECETICVIKRDESLSIDLQNHQSSRNESYKKLLKLPKFGEKVSMNDDDDDGLEIIDNEVVRINTPAPVGIHLPNGQKKMCLTTGLPAMYYDPTNGVPYATVDAFKILKSLVDGEYEWLQLDNGGINSRFAGGVGCYIGKKNQRHAKGVPEGF